MSKKEKNQVLDALAGKCDGTLYSIPYVSSIAVMSKKDASRAQGAGAGDRR
jgi:hypothetical protein